MLRPAFSLAAELPPRNHAAPAVPTPPPNVCFIELFDAEDHVAGSAI